MTPPPTDNDDPFGGMDPMAWLESLARRQGANPDELTTAADIDVPVPPADTVIDEPGYTPYDTGSSKPKAAAPIAQKPPSKTEQAVPPPAADDPFGGMDPMAWLESLAKRQGANPDELTTAADIDVPVPPAGTVIDEPGYTPGYDTGKAKAVEPVARKPVQPPEPKATPPPAQQPAAQKPVEPPVPSPQSAPAQPVAAQPISDDSFGGMDPMAWLESLAKRQGANPDELTTAANIDVPLPSADAKVTGPGYTPGYDTGKPKAAEPAAEQPVTPSVEPKVAPAPQPPAQQPPVQPVAQQPTTMQPATSDDLLGGMDPLSWLESLARRQGANPDELITGGLGEIPAVPEGAVPNEPGYSDYTPFGETPAPSEELPTPSMSAAEAERLLGINPQGEAEENPLSEMDPLAWLESLAAPSPLSTSDFTNFETPTMETSEAMEATSALTWLEELARENQALPAAAVEDTWLETTIEPVNETGGISDDLEEVQRWLNTQAGSLGAIHDDEFVDYEEGADLAPAEPGELPSWLMDKNPTKMGTGPLSDELFEPPTPVDLPDWLRNDAEIVPTTDLTLDQNSNFLTPETSDVADLEAEADISPDELAALTQPEASGVPDPWAEALDEEYERRLAGDESIPDWYVEALARNGEATDQIAAPEAQALPPPQPDVIKAGDLPDWLQEMEPQTAEPAPALPGDVPAWLLEGMPDDFTKMVAEPQSPASTLAPEFDATNLDNWFDQVEPAELPDWLQPAAPAEAKVAPIPAPAEPAAKAPEPTPAPAVPPVAKPPAPAPQPAVAATPMQQQPEPLSDVVLANHMQRLRHARELVAQDRHSESLIHYESLIDDKAALDDVIEDMAQLSTVQPKNPRIRRLLGDAHMRKGNLQEALDTYRSALDQL